jgi:hypothetical protein
MLGAIIASRRRASGVDQPADNKALIINVGDACHLQIQLVCKCWENGDARFAAVIDLAGGTRPESAGMYGEDERSEGIGVFVIERTIDEYVFRGGRPSEPMVIRRK